MGSVSGEEVMPLEKMHEPGGGMVERIFVSVRLRPLNSKEISKHDASDWERVNDSTLVYKNAVSEQRSMYPSAYTFDRVFGKDSPTKKVYEEAAKEVALSVVGGINSSIFAYGQTSSGKTYTMTGVTEFAVQDIYQYCQKHTERTFVLKFSAMEIYNEAVRDLLSTDQTPLRLLDDPERGTVVDKLTEETLRDYDHLKELLAVCEAQRQIGETSLNEVSSRSHQIIRLTIESSAREYLGKDSSSLAASVHFVDLAGSERASQTNSAGARLKEGCHINRSLLTLGTVVRKLSKGRNGHVPYRDSKLTRILQCSLGGNGRTAIICTISPARSHVEQTRNTLSFASCAKEVTTNAQVNVVMSDKALVKHLQRQLTRLESELSSVGSKYANRDSASLLREKDRQIEKMENEIKELTLQRDIAQARLYKLIQEGHVQDPELLAEFSHYPRLRAPVTLGDEPASPVLSEYYRVRRFNRSQYSSACSESSFGECAKVNLEEHYLFDGPSPRLYVISPEHGSPNPYKNWEGITHEDGDEFEELCKDVRCVELEGSTTNSIAASGPLSCAEGESTLPSTFTEANTTTEQTSVSSPLNEHEVAHAESTDGGVEKKLQDVPESSDYDDSETVMTESRSPLHSKEEEIGYTSPSRSEKDFLEGRSEKDFLEGRSEKDYLEGQSEKDFLEGRSEKDFLEETLKGTQEKYSNPSSSCISREYSLSSMRSDSSEELKSHNIEEIQVREQKINLDVKSMKDIGLDPMQESPSNWPLEFKRLQKEIIELWHVCHVSLVHRTHFFLLFTGDSSDSIYMEVERRRLSFLKNLYAQPNLDKLYIEGARDLTPTSSKRALRRERETLSKLIHKKIPKDEREKLFQKWGIGLNSKERKLQLAHRLWTNTEDMNHITESAKLVARLVGLEEGNQSLKEMFILSFTPQKSHRRSKTYNWRATP